MKNQKLNFIDADATHARTSNENEKLRRNLEEPKKGMGTKNRLPHQNAAALNARDDEDEMIRCWEMEALCWGE